jgi:hypothetical protein
MAKEKEIKLSMDYPRVSRVQEWVLFYLIEREKNGQITQGKDLLWPEDVEPLVDLGLVKLEQSNVIPSLQKKVMGTTIVQLTSNGRTYFER